MGTLQEAARTERLAAIVTLVQEKPYSIAAISEALSASYHTIRRDVMELVETKRIRPATSRDPGGKMLFIAGAESPMPLIHNEATDKMVPITMLAEAYLAAAKNGFASNASLAAVGVLEVAADLMHKIAFMEAGGELTQRDIAPLRKQLLTYKTLLDSTASMAEQMLSLRQLWAPESLFHIATDDSWDGERMEKVYQQAIELKTNNG